MKDERDTGSPRPGRGRDSVARALEGMPRVPAPPGFAEKVLAIVLGGLPGPREEGGNEGHRRGYIYIVGAAALGVALAVGLAVARRVGGHASRADDGGSLTALRPV